VSPENHGIAPLTDLVIVIYGPGSITEDSACTDNCCKRGSLYTLPVARIERIARYGATTFPVMMNVFVSHACIVNIGSLAIHNERRILLSGVMDELR